MEFWQQPLSMHNPMVEVKVVPVLIMVDFAAHGRAFTRIFGSFDTHEYANLFYLFEMQLYT